MTKITLIGNEQYQKMKLLLDNSKEFTLFLRYAPHQLCWFFSIEYGDKKINNMKLTTSGNILHQWRNTLPFGIKCETENNHEPMFQDDFISGRCSLYVLSYSEVNNFAEVVSGKRQA